MKDQIFETTNSDFVCFLRVKNIPIVKAEKINFKQVAFSFDDKSGEASLLWEQWQMNPTKEMQLIQDFVAEKEKILTTIKHKMKIEDRNGGYYGKNYQ